MSLPVPSSGSPYALKPLKSSEAAGPGAAALTFHQRLAQLQQQQQSHSSQGYESVKRRRRIKTSPNSAASLASLSSFMVLPPLDIHQQTLHDHFTRNSANVSKKSAHPAQTLPSGPLAYSSLGAESAVPEPSPDISPGADRHYRLGQHRRSFSASQFSDEKTASARPVLDAVVAASTSGLFLKSGPSGCGGNNNNSSNTTKSAAARKKKLGLLLAPLASPANRKMLLLRTHDSTGSSGSSGGSGSSGSSGSSTSGPHHKRRTAKKIWGTVSSLEKRHKRAARNNGSSSRPSKLDQQLSSKRSSSSQINRIETVRVLRSRPPFFPVKEKFPAAAQAAGSKAVVVPQVSSSSTLSPFKRANTAAATVSPISALALAVPEADDSMELPRNILGTQITLSVNKAGDLKRKRRGNLTALPPSSNLQLAGNSTTHAS